MNEREIIQRLRRIATAPGARGLLDDVAVLDAFVITHDTIAEGVHFLAHDRAQEKQALRKLQTIGKRLAKQGAATTAA